ncbi:hypothetical protein YC2023_006622 [Brassica napus]
MDAYWKHDLSILWTVTQLTEQCRLRSNDLYMGNNRSSCLRWRNSWVHLIGEHIGSPTNEN